MARAARVQADNEVSARPPPCARFAAARRGSDRRGQVAVVMDPLPPTPLTRSKRPHGTLGPSPTQTPNDPYDVHLFHYVSVAMSVEGSRQPKSYAGQLVWSSRERQRFMVVWLNGDEPTMFEGSGPGSFRVHEGVPETNSDGILLYETADIAQEKVSTNHQLQLLASITSAYPDIPRALRRNSVPSVLRLPQSRPAALPLTLACLYPCAPLPPGQAHGR